MGNNIKIITDNGCDLPVEWLEKNNIHLIRFGLNIDDKEYEGETGTIISTDEFYLKIKEGAMPKTSQINPFTAREHIEPFLKDGYDVLYVSFSSGLSGSCNSVKLAALELNDDYPERKVYVIDSLCASLGQGLFLDYIVKYIKEDTIIEDVYEYAESLKLNICHDVAVNDLFHLKRGGRVSTASAILGTILSIKPVLHVDNNGKLVVIDKVRGRKHSIRKLFDYFIENNVVTDDDPIFISHADCCDEAMVLANMIQENKPNNKVYVNYIGPIIGSHTGQGTIALFYKGKSRNH